MPHRCVKCGAVYEDSSPTLLTGCTCGSRFFFFFKKPETQEEIKELTKEEVEEIVQEVTEILGPQVEDVPVILDFESINVKEPGKFEIDLVNLFKRNPLVYKVSDGKYIIDIASTFQLSQKSKDKKDKKKK
jgi:predicted  nucleic acid-binding Zn-ribbon protein